jgi:hypothetical protein
LVIRDWGPDHSLGSGNKGEKQMSRLAQITERFISPSKVQVVEIFIGENGGQSFELTVYEKKKNSVEIKEQREKFEGEQEFISKLKDKSVPIILCVDGKGILIKKISGEAEDANNLVGRIIPNAKPEDFYIEQIFTGNENSIVSIVRRSAIDQAIDALAHKGFSVVHLHIGPGVTSCLSGILVSDNTVREFVWRNYRLTYSSSGIADITKGAAEQESELPIEKNIFFAFAAACSFFSGWRKDNSILLGEKVQQASSSFYEKKKFTFYAAGIVIFFLVALLTNFFIFQHYWKIQQELESQVGWQESAVKNYDEMKKNIGDKMNFALETGLLSEEKLAWFADQLGASVPQGVKLVRMNIYPREKKITDGDEAFVFDQHIITISGYAGSESLLNDWIRAIKEKEFAGKVQLSSYLQDGEKNTGIFSIEIILK